VVLCCTQDRARRFRAGLVNFGDFHYSTATGVGQGFSAALIYVATSRMGRVG
jgi:hypothetical protein